MLAVRCESGLRTSRNGFKSCFLFIVPLPGPLSTIFQLEKSLFTLFLLICRLRSMSWMAIEKMIGTNTSCFVSPRHKTHRTLVRPVQLNKKKSGYGVVRRGEGVVHHQCSRPGIQTIEFVYLGEAITADGELSIEISRRLQRAWACVQRYKMEINDRPGVRLRLKVRLLKAEVIETIFYGCMAWSPNKPDYDRPRRVHHSMLRCLGWRKRQRNDHTLSCADALAKTASESIEVIVRKRRILFTGFVARMGEKHLPRGVMFGELVGGNGYLRGPEKGWFVHLKQDMSVFGMKFEGWSKAAQKGGRWFRRVEEGAEFCMRK